MLLSVWTMGFRDPCAVEYGLLKHLLSVDVEVMLSMFTVDCLEVIPHYRLNLLRQTRYPNSWFPHCITYHPTSVLPKFLHWLPHTIPRGGARATLPHMVAKGLGGDCIKCTIIPLFEAWFSYCTFSSGFNALDHHPVSLLSPK